MNNLKFPFNAPLNPQDRADRTYGCRANNPNVCGNNGLQGMCAFVNDDCICRKPSRAWKKQFAKLSEAEAAAKAGVFDEGVEKDLAAEVTAKETSKKSSSSK